MTAEKNTKQTTNNRPGTSGKFVPKKDGKPGNNKRRGRGRGRGPKREVKEFEQKILDLSRVTRVTAGGKRMSVRCALVIGDKKGRVGLGVAKGADVQIAIEKAYKQAKKKVVTVPIYNETIPHSVLMKYCSALVLLKPAPKGTGLKSGGAMRMILEFAGVPNAVSKILNSNNKINLARATIEAIKELRTIDTSKTDKGSKKKVIKKAVETKNEEQVVSEEKTETKKATKKVAE